MTIAQSLLPEFDQEMATTRRVLERVPEDNLDFRPDPKSMTMARLAGHVAEMPGYAVATMTTPELDFAAGDYQPGEMTSREQILAIFDKLVADSRAAIAGASDEALMQNWSLKNNGEIFFTMPRVACLRGMVMNHLIHHRGQLSVYLRLTGAKVPSIYGPSADEGQMPGADSANA
jgi:uncharacterized damage-inducible protein DinB